MKNIPGFFLSFVLIAMSTTVQGQTPVKDPAIPNGEWAVYRITTDEETEVVRENVVIRQEGGRAFYEITAESGSEKTVVRIFKDTMVPFSLQTSSSNSSFTSETSTQIRQKTRIESPHILLLGMEDLRYTLRGFPFDRSGFIFIKTIGAAEEEGSQFAMKAKNRSRETLSVGERKIDCYKLQLHVSFSGPFSIINGLIPKSYFWYSTASPHYLVAYEINYSGPGTSKSYVEIIDYSGWE